MKIEKVLNDNSDELNEYYRERENKVSLCKELKNNCYGDVSDCHERSPQLLPSPSVYQKVEKFISVNYDWNERVVIFDRDELLFEKMENR